MPAYSIPKGYVHKFCILLFSSCLGDLCLHIQFPMNIFTSVVMILNEKLTRGETPTCIGFLGNSNSRGSFSG